MDVLYHLGTLAQALVALGGLMLGVHYAIRRGGMDGPGWAVLFLLCLAANEFWWTLARLAFADVAWVHGPVTALVGMDAKLFFEQSSLVLFLKLGMFVGLCGRLWAVTGRERARVPREVRQAVVREVLLAYDAESEPAVLAERLDRILREGEEAKV